MYTQLFLKELSVHYSFFIISRFPVFTSENNFLIINRKRNLYNIQKILTLREKHVNIVKNRRIGSRKIVEFDEENHRKSDNKLVK